MLYSHPALLYILTLFIRSMSVRSTFHHAIVSKEFVCIHDLLEKLVDGLPSTALSAGAAFVVEDCSAGLFNARFSENKSTNQLTNYDTSSKYS